METSIRNFTKKKTIIANEDITLKQPNSIETVKIKEEKHDEMELDAESGFYLHKRIKLENEISTGFEFNEVLIKVEKTEVTENDETREFETTLDRNPILNSCVNSKSRKNEELEVLFESEEHKVSAEIKREENFENSVQPELESNLRKPRQKKCKKLSLNEKLNAIKLVDEGVSKKEIAQKLGVSLAAICYVLANKEKYIQNTQSKLSQTRTRIDKGENPVLENILLEWIKQKRSLNIPVNGPAIKEKALCIKEELLQKKRRELQESGVDSGQCQEIATMEKFLASQGWLHRFKTRNCIGQISQKGEKTSVDKDVTFQDEMKKFLAEHEYSFDNIYNVDEAGLFTKSLPNKTLALSEEMKEFKLEEFKERVTIVTCANATGTHQVPLMLIGRTRNPRCLRKIKNKLPLVYKSQKNSWMTRELFLDWYQNIFIPCVKERKPGNEEKFLLILDNAPCHPSAEELNSINCQFIVKFLPHNVLSSIQPMDQGVIDSLRMHYKHFFLQKLIFEDSHSPAAIANFIKNWKLSDTIFLVEYAWNCVTLETLSKAWKAFLDNKCITSQSDIRTEEIITNLDRIHDSKTFSSSEIDEWIGEDNYIPTWCKLSLNQLIEKLTRNADNGTLEKEEKETDDDIFPESDPESSSEENVNLLKENETTYNDAKMARNNLMDLKKWFLGRSNVTSEDIKSIHHLETAIEKELYSVSCRSSF